MASKVLPIKPEEVIPKRESTIPDKVFEAFNELITKNLSGGSARVNQDDVVELIVSKGINREKIFEQHWLDVEDLYRKAGWDVEFDKPGFNESYKAHFIFRERGKRDRRR